MEHYYTIVVEQPDVYKWNYYQTHALHLHRHGQVSMHRITVLTDGLGNDGFVQLSSRQSCGNEKDRTNITIFAENIETT